MGHKDIQEFLRTVTSKTYSDTSSLRRIERGERSLPRRYAIALGVRQYGYRSVDDINRFLDSHGYPPLTPSEEASFYPDISPLNCLTDLDLHRGAYVKLVSLRLGTVDIFYQLAGS